MGNVEKTPVEQALETVHRLVLELTAAVADLRAEMTGRAVCMPPATSSAALRVHALVRRRGALSGRDLARATQFLNRSERNAVLRELEDKGLVSIERQRNPQGRPGFVVRVGGEAAP